MSVVRGLNIPGLVAAVAVFAGVAIIELEASAAPRCVEEFTAYRESKPDGAYLDWFAGNVGYMGRAVKYKNLEMKPFFLEAKQAAVDNAHKRILAYLGSLPIDGTRRLMDEVSLAGTLKTLVEVTPPAKVELSLPWTVTALVKVPLYGDKGILRLVLHESRKTAQDPGPESPPSPVAEVPVAGVGGMATGDAVPTGLVIDATQVHDLAPALLPKVIDEKGRVIHSVETADVQAASARGLAAYALRIEVSKSRMVLEPREGLQPMRVPAIGATGPGMTQVIVSVADADRILKAAESSSFLKECRVLIIMPPAGPAPAPPRPATAGTSKPASRSPIREKQP